MNDRNQYNRKLIEEFRANRGRSDGPLLLTTFVEHQAQAEMKGFLDGRSPSRPPCARRIA